MRFKKYGAEWNSALLEQVVSIYDGTHQTPIYTESGVKFVSVENIKDLYASNKYISYEDFKENYKIVPQAGDILMTRIGDIGTPALVTTNEDLAYYVSLALLKVGKSITAKYLLQYIQTSFFKKELWEKTLHIAFPIKINKGDIGLCKVQYPNSSEQEEIAHFLALIDQRINTQSKIIEKLQSQMKAIYHNIFTDCGDDSVFPLRSICTIKKGTQLNGTELFDSGDFYVMNGGITPSGYYNQCNTEENTISISEGGNSCGYVQYNKERFWSGGHCYTLNNLSSNIIPKYLYHFLKAHEEEIMRMRIGTGLPNIQKKDLESFGVYVPDIDRQAQILSLLDCFEEKIVVEKKLLEKLREQKKYLLSNMFI